MGSFRTLLTTLVLVSGFAHAAGYEEISDDLLNVRVEGIQSPLSMQIERDGQELDYQPNSPIMMGLGVSYNIFDVAAHFIPLHDSEDPAAYGKSKALDFEFYVNLSPVYFDVYFQKFDGYYLRNSAEAINGSDTKPLLRADLKTSKAGLNATYVFNDDDFALPASFGAQIIQRESAGSWMLFTGVGTQTIEAKKGVLAPAGFETVYGGAGNLESARYTQMFFGGGYGYSWVFAPGWFLHGSGLLGVGPQYLDATTRDFGHETGWDVAKKGSVRFAVGYSGERFFGGITGIGDANYYSFAKDSQITLWSLYVNMNFGMRIGL